MLCPIHFGAAMLASLGVACAPGVQVQIDQRKDFAGYCTWNFLSLGSGNVRSPLPDTREIDARLTELIEQGLGGRGFARVSGRPDFYVTYLLEARHQSVVVTETPAVEYLPSLHRDESYEIQVTNQRIENYEIGHLTILLSDPDEQAVIWRGAFKGRFLGAFSRHLEDAVWSLLERLPSSAAATGAAPDAGAPGRADLTQSCVR